MHTSMAIGSCGKTVIAVLTYYYYNMFYNKTFANYIIFNNGS